jgi:hypothetical protein
MILYLLLGDSGGELGYPNWYPAELFDVIDRKLPSNWHYAFLGIPSYLNAIWGYDELVNVEGHFDKISEREESALMVFVKRRRETDLIPFGGLDS